MRRPPSVVAAVLADLAMLGVLGSVPLAAQTPAPDRIHDVTEQELVYRVPGMDRVAVRENVPFLRDGATTLALDVYAPPDSGKAGPKGALLPAVVFINGVGNTPSSRLKDWGIYRSWGRLIAASGWIGVTFDARGPHDRSGADIRALFAHLRAEGATLGIDPDRIAAWVCSGNVTSGLPALMDGVDAGVRGAAVYYGSATLPKIRTDFPIYFVRAGRDNPRLNAAIDALWTQAIAAGAPWTMVNAPRLHHAFDALDETAESRAIVRDTLEFYRDIFAPPPAPAPPSPAKAALSHWFGGREPQEAAAAYSEYVKAHPNDATAWLRLGLSQAATKDSGAEASLEKAVALGGKAPLDLYNAACGYALIGRTDDALGLLERAVAAGFRDKRLLETDTDLASLRGSPRYQALLAGLGA